MGLFGNRGEKRNIKQPAQNSQYNHYTGANNVSNMYKNKYTVEMSTTREGYLCVELIEMGPTDPNQFYDTTRLIVRGNPKIMGNGVPVQDCLVSHYGQEDAIYLDGGQEFGRRTDYKHILAEFDVNRLMSDNLYAAKLMKNLLNERRVQKYLEQGMQENSEQPCGMYVGGMNPEGRKYFRPDVGRESHYSPTMQQKRARRKEYKLRNMQSEYDRNREEIEKLERRNQNLRDSMDDDGR